MAQPPWGPRGLHIVESQSLTDPVFWGPGKLGCPQEEGQGQQGLRPHLRWPLQPVLPPAAPPPSWGGLPRGLLGLGGLGWPPRRLPSVGLLLSPESNKRCHCLAAVSLLLRLVL